MKIVLFTDSHYCSKEVTCKTRRPILSLGKVRAMLDACLDADLILCLGDLIDDCGDTDENIARTAELMTCIRASGIPFYSLMGNHDCHAFTRDAFAQLTGGAIPPFAMQVGSTALIFLDACYSDDGTAYAPGKVNWKNTYLPEAQLDRLREILAADSVTDAYIFSHQNFDPEVQVNHIIRNAEAARAIFAESGKVRAVIQGHYHRGHDTTIDGIAYHTLPAMCEGERNYYEVMEL